jgi:DNA-binding LytR/AlgR family response regulator
MRIRNIGLPCDIDVFASAEELLLSPEAYDLFLLDIYLGHGMSGIELARRIRQQSDTSEIVFITVSDAHALEGFEVNALQYLLKPVATAALNAMLERYIAIRDRRNLNYCTVVVEKKDVKIYHSEIYYVESFDKYCAIHTANGVIDAYASLSGLLGKLPTPPFLRCHRSFVVNMNHVGAVERDFVMKDGQIVYIRKSNHTQIKRRYMDYLTETARSAMHEKVSV